MPVVRLDLAYDGTNFHGYAKQPSLRTVQGELEAVLEQIVGSVKTSVAGRTDSGVHARHQVVSFESDSDPAKLQRSINRMLGPEVVVTSASTAPAEFNARWSAIGRRYRYSILNRDWPDPFQARTSWHYRHPLDADSMTRSLQPLLGEKDFAGFCRKNVDKSTVRTLKDAVWRRDGELVALDIRADSFCQHMVRSIVALSVEIGRGRLPETAMKDLLESGDRNTSKGAAPARGLTLWEVEY